MANIVLTNNCNLRCPYCFADEFVNNDVEEVSLEYMKKILNFLAEEEKDNVFGLIGGEPMLHSMFKSLIQIILDDDRFSAVAIYTNGLLVDRYIEVLVGKKLYFLINCNSPQDMGYCNYNKFIYNLNLLKSYRMLERVTLGINLYKKDFDYSYILDVLTHYKMQKVRVSISVPNNNSENFDWISYFLSMKSVMLNFCEELLKLKITPIIDCNKIPKCFYDKKEIEHFEFIGKCYGMEHSVRSIFSENTKCEPVIDIMMNYKVVRCFGLSDCSMVDLRDFRSLSDLKDYYHRNIDCYAFSDSDVHRCSKCEWRKHRKCMGGCLKNKWKEIC